MGTSVYDQLRQIVAALVTGGLIGLLFDVLCSLTNRESAAKKLLRFTGAIGSALLVFTVGRASGAGMRLFFLLAVAGGICFYLWALHPMVRSRLSVIKHHLQYYAHTTHRNAVSKNKYIRKHREN